MSLMEKTVGSNGVVIRTVKKGTGEDAALRLAAWGQEEDDCRSRMWTTAWELGWRRTQERQRTQSIGSNLKMLLTSWAHLEDRRGEWGRECTGWIIWFQCSSSLFFKKKFFYFFWTVRLNRSCLFHFFSNFHTHLFF